MQWHLSCRVVDNFGDIGVAWRLAADLAGRGELVRLAVDDATALAWMAPAGAAGVEVAGWDAQPGSTPDVLVELFGGGRPPNAWRSGARVPLLVNVEHLSAEAFVERSHGLPSPTQRAGEPPSTTWFFYPGFTRATGGLLREPGLLARRERFGRGDDWLAAIGAPARAGERRVSLFCYRNEAVGALLDTLALAPTLLLLTPGPAAEQVAAALGPELTRGGMRAWRLPLLDQNDFDRLLWSCDLNFVRGEDSFVRAIWAGAPFVWQPYVQADGAHLLKLSAFLDRFLGGAPAGLSGAVRAVFERWSGLGGAASNLEPLDRALAAGWQRHCSSWRNELAAQDDLTAQLVRFAESKR